MGTDCAPYLANLFLFYYEHEWMMKTKETNPKLARQFNKSARYIDNLLTINNDGLMMNTCLTSTPENSNSNMKTVGMTNTLHTLTWR